MISAQKENFLFSSLEKGGRYGTRKPGTHHLRLPHGNSRLPRHFCLQGLQVILLSLPRAGILMSILRELFRKFPFFLSDRSRPPHAGPCGHTCAESADRTAPAKHTQAWRALPFPFRTSVSFRQCALPAHSLPAAPAKPGGRIRGELFLTLQTSTENTSPFAQDTLHGLHRLYGGGV